MAAAEFKDSRVLIIDDNAANTELLVAYLHETGARIITASGGNEGLAKARAEQPDVILLDVKMPDLSGFDVCRILKGDANTRDIPIIMVTALAAAADVEKGIDAGTDDFLSKPVNRLELLTRVKSLLGTRHLKGELARTLAYLEEVEKRTAGK